MPDKAALKSAWRKRLAADFGSPSGITPLWVPAPDGSPGVQFEGSEGVFTFPPRPFRFSDLCREVLGPYHERGGREPDIQVEALYELAAETGRLEEFDAEWERAKRKR